MLLPQRSEAAPAVHSLWQLAHSRRWPLAPCPVAQWSDTWPRCSASVHRSHSCAVSLPPPHAAPVMRRAAITMLRVTLLSCRSSSRAFRAVRGSRSGGTPPVIVSVLPGCVVLSLGMRCLCSLGVPQVSGQMENDGDEGRIGVGCVALTEQQQTNNPASNDRDNRWLCPQEGGFGKDREGNGVSFGKRGMP